MAKLVKVGLTKQAAHSLIRANMYIDLLQQACVLLLQDVRKIVLAHLPACNTMVTEIVAHTRDVSDQVSISC